MQEITFGIDSLDKATIRSLIWDGLDSKWAHESYYPTSYSASADTIYDAVVELAIKKGRVHYPAGGACQYIKKKSPKSQAAISEALWELVMQGVLYLESPKSSVYNITEHGLKVLQECRPIPNDPDGYLAYLKKEVPDIDDVVLRYVTEAINAYNQHLELAATATLGCASEKAILLLIDAYTDSLPDDMREKFRSKCKNTAIKSKFDAFTSYLQGHMDSYSGEHKSHIKCRLSEITPTFNMLRLNRNDAGHPSGETMPHDMVFASLQVFITYCKSIHGLIHYFQANGENFGSD